MRRLALVLLLAGCSSTASSRWDRVQSVEWVLVKLEDAPTLAGAEISLTFDVGRLYGRAVNRYGAQYERTEDTLLIDGVAATKKHLDQPKGAMEQEARYLKLLEQCDGWECGGGWLELKRKGDTILWFRRRDSTARS